MWPGHAATGGCALFQCIGMTGLRTPSASVTVCGVSGRDTSIGENHRRRLDASSGRSRVDWPGSDRRSRNHCDPHLDGDLHEHA